VNKEHCAPVRQITATLLIDIALARWLMRMQYWLEAINGNSCMQA
jgi:hypothetical protein